MNLSGYITTDNIRFIETRNKFTAIEELARTFEGSEICSDVSILVSALKEREDIMSTGIGFGIAIPHAKIAQVNKLAFAVGISKTGIDFSSMDGIPVRLIILVLAGEKQHTDYLGLLSRIMNMLRIDAKKDAIINASSADEIIKIISQN